MSVTPNMSKREQARQYILNLIEEQNLSQGDKLPTEKQLCNTLGVSRITVQTALETLQKCGQVYRVQGGGTYVGAAPTPPPTKTIKPDFIPFIINHNTPHAGWLELINGAEDYLKPHNCYVTVHSPNGDRAKEQEIIQMLLERGARSLIILPMQRSIEPSLWFDLIRQGIRLVFVDFLPAGLMGNLISSNNILGGYLMTKHLLEQGYKRIGVISGRLAPTSQDRINGFRLALNEAQIPINEDYVRIDESICTRRDLIAKAPRFVDDLLSLPSPPDALFCMNDYTASDIYHVLSLRGLRVPDDIALAGFDNLPISAENKVPISTVAQDFYRIGYEAAKLCYEGTTSPDSVCSHHFFPVQLIPRESTRRTK